MSKRILFSGIFFLLISFSGIGQVINPPLLQCVNNNNTNGDITLYWTNPVNNCGPFVQYTIYGSPNGPGGPYTSVTAVTNQSATSQVLTNFLATSNTWYFYMEANYNCPGATVLQSDTVSNQPPDVPTLVNVTVTQSGQAIINWDVDPAPQTSYYIVYYYLPNGLASPFDTVYGRTNTTATDLMGDPTTTSLVYTVSAYDSCGNHSGFNTAPHNTIYATARGTECERQININWNKYINWPNDVGYYQIWVNKNHSGFEIVDTISPTFTSYTYTQFDDGDSLGIFIRGVSAADTNITSSSNLIEMKATIVQPPKYIYITNLTVNADNRIEVTWTIDTIAHLIFYKVLRGTDSSTFAPLSQFDVPTPLMHFQTFVDSNDVSPQNNPYFYEMDAYDSCQTQYLSPWGETVSLNAQLYDYYVAEIKWNDFSLAYATVTKYNLYRDMGAGYHLIHTFQPGTNLYYDSLQQFLYEKGTFCYKIEAVYDINLPAPSGYKATLSSFSNISCVIHRPVIYIPNAFAPNGLNNIFKPTIIYGNPQGYSMIIFNRWGGKVFESEDPNVGWDGSDHGKQLPLGGYAYLIQFTADDGVVIERKGIVLLVK